MPSDALNIAVWTVAGVAGLLAVYQFMFLPTMTETFRSELFEIRRQLFLLMADGVIAADDPAYVRLRLVLNRLLLTAHRITFLRGWVSRFITPQGGSAAIPPLQAFITQIPGPDARGRVRALHDQMHNAISHHLMRTSPILWVLVLAAIPIEIVRRITGGRPDDHEGLQRRLPSDAVESEALSELDDCLFA